MAYLGKKVTLKTNREVELFPLTVKQRCEIEDIALLKIEQGFKNFSMLHFYTAVSCATQKTDEQLTQEGWTDIEIIECAEIVFKDLRLSNTDKKK